MSTPAAEGKRRPFSSLPPNVVAAVEDLLGAAVVGAEDQRGGFSPGVAARLRLADGSRAFVKAVSDDPNPTTPTLLRREAEVTAGLPSGAPAPRLLGSTEVGPWVVLALEDVDGRQPHLPWREAELRRVVAALDLLAATCTPSPVALPTAAEAFAGEFAGWRRIADEPSRLHAVGWLGDQAGWVGDHVERLAALETGWEEATTGDTLVHADVRADNVLLTDAGVVFVDWPWACVGAATLDLVFALPSIAMQSTADPDDVLGWSRTGRAASADQVDTLIAALAGYFTWYGQLPPDPGLEPVRAFQQAQAVAATGWLRRRLERG